MGRKGKDKGSAGFEAVQHSGSGSNIEESKEQSMKLRHVEIRGVKTDTGKVTFEQANKQAYIRSNTHCTVTVREICPRLSVSIQQTRVRETGDVGI
jgi:hypothetical protein